MRSFTKRVVQALCVSSLLALLPLGPGGGSRADDFYKGRTISFVIASAPGGGYDTYSRLVAGHIGQHLEGLPTVVPQIMPGANSQRAAHYIYNVAPKDGTTIDLIDE